VLELAAQCFNEQQPYTANGGVIMSILALDVGTRCGWATYSNGRYSGQEIFRVRYGESPGMIRLHFRDWMQRMMKLIGYIDFICYTQTSPISNPDANRCKGLLTTLQEVADKYKIRLIRNQIGFYSEFQLDELNKDTYQFIKAAKAQGWSPETYREAKATLLWEFENSLYIFKDTTAMNPN